MFCQMPDARCQMPDARCQMPDARITGLLLVISQYKKRKSCCLWILESPYGWERVERKHVHAVQILYSRHSIANNHYPSAVNCYKQQIFRFPLSCLKKVWVKLNERKILENY